MSFLHHQPLYNSRPLHGGDIQTASRRFGIPVADWLDLSTGISPWSWPVPQIPEAVWQQLPHRDDTSLIMAAAQYYDVDPSSITALPGSQMAIRRLPAWLVSSRVAIPAMGYQEHAYAWQRAGHTLVVYHSLDHLYALIDQRQVDHVVVINPNNPSCDCITLTDVLEVFKKLDSSAYMLVDEAFMDASILDHSVAQYTNDRLLVLRSFGKFFGLAGVRLGFLLGHSEWIERLRDELTPWGVSHPAQFIGRLALLDEPWHGMQKQRLQKAVEQLVDVLKAVFDSGKGYRIRQGSLFCTLLGKQVELSKLHHSMASQGILLRYGEMDNQDTAEDLAWLRFGLPGDHVQRLQQALTFIR